MLYAKRKLSTAIMTCTKAEKDRIGGWRLTLEDDKGEVICGWGVTFQGHVRRALGLGRDEALANGIGKKVEVFFGVNGNAQSLTKVEE